MFSGLLMTIAENDFNGVLSPGPVHVVMWRTLEVRTTSPGTCRAFFNEGLSHPIDSLRLVLRVAHLNSLDSRLNCGNGCLISTIASANCLIFPCAQIQ